MKYLFTIQHNKTGIFIAGITYAEYYIEYYIEMYNSITVCSKQSRMLCIALGGVCFFLNIAETFSYYTHAITPTNYPCNKFNNDVSQYYTVHDVSNNM